MPRVDTNRLLDQLDEAKRHFRRGEHKQIERLLDRLIRFTFKDSESLIRFHEILLFLRAYPQSPRILRIAESALSSFSHSLTIETRV